MPTTSQWVSFTAGGELFAFDVRCVREIHRLAEIRAGRPSEAHQNGVVIFHGEEVPVLDLRVLLGKPSRLREAAETIEWLKGRQQDHEAWLAELEACVREHRHFGLPTDPHKCRFGQWYDQFETDDPWLRRLIESLSAPHERIHEAAAEIVAAMARNDYAEAAAAISRMRDTRLRELLDALASTYGYLSASACPTLLIVGAEGTTIAVAVDDFCGVIYSDDARISRCDSSEKVAGCGGVVGVIFDPIRAQFVLMLDPAQIRSQFSRRDVGSKL
jgi:chemotaxis signal transduction protein